MLLWQSKIAKRKENKTEWSECSHILRVFTNSMFLLDTLKTSLDLPLSILHYSGEARSWKKLLSCLETTLLHLLLPFGRELSQLKDTTKKIKF